MGRCAAMLASLSVTVCGPDVGLRAYEQTVLTWWGGPDGIEA